MDCGHISVKDCCDMLTVYIASKRWSCAFALIERHQAFTEIRNKTI